MRTLSKVLISFFILSLFLLFPGKALAVTSVVDQYEYVPLPPSADAGYWFIKRSGSNVVKQTFKPTKNKLDKVYAYLNGNGSTATVNMAILDAGANSIGSMNASAPSSANGSWVLFDFSTDLSVTAEDTYQIVLTTTSATAYWRVDQSPEYTRGHAVVDGVVKLDQNFGFETSGYDAAAPVPPPASPPPAAPPSDTPEPASTPAPAASSNTPTTTTTQTDAPAAAAQTTAPQKTAATASAKTTPKTATSAATTETKGVFQNSLVLLLLAVLVVILSGVLVYYRKKKKAKTAPVEVKPTEEIKPTEEVK